MRGMRIGVIVSVALVGLAGSAMAATPTRLTISAPAAVGQGEAIAVAAHLSDAGGRPMVGAKLVFYQVGAVGERQMAEQTTDASGTASFNFTESEVRHLALAVVFAGDSRYTASRALAHVEISGVDVPPAVPMAATPPPVVKVLVFSVLGAVWATYALAFSCIWQIVHHHRNTPEGRGLGGRRF